MGDYNYILTSKGELYHASSRKGEEREDHKYISREWKNGRWNYTYADDAKSKTSNAKSDYQKKSNAAATYAKQAQSARVKNIANVADSDKPSGSYTALTNQKRRHELNAAAKKAENNYYSTTEGKIDRKVDNAKASIKKAADNAKNWVKDMLGYDEKDKATNAATKARVKQYEAEDERAENKAYVDRVGKENISNNLKVAMRQVEINKESDAAYAKWDAEYSAKAFAMTPLAKLEKVKESINSAKEYVSDLLDSYKVLGEYKAAEREVEKSEKALNKARKEYEDALDKYDATSASREAAEQAYEKAYKAYLLDRLVDSGMATKIK